ELPGVDPRGAQRGKDQLAVLTGADRGQQAALGSRTRRRNGLIRTLAAGHRDQLVAENCLSGARQSGPGRNEIDVAAADHHQPWAGSHGLLARFIAMEAVRRARSSNPAPSKPRRLDAIRFRSGSVHRAGSRPPPAIAPATPPAVAPLESVSQPPVTVTQMLLVKSPSPTRRPYATRAALFTACTQCRPPYAGGRR